MPILENDKVFEQSQDDQPIEAERYELREPGQYSFDSDRRSFVQTLGSGLVLVVAASSATIAKAQRGRSARRDERLAERFHLGQDGTVTLLTSKVEVGQGSRTQLTQAVAEELRLPVERIRLIMADTAQCPDDGGTAGSRTTPSTVPRVRNAAAAIRAVLVQHAAQRFGVEPDRVSYDGGIYRAGENHQLTIAELAMDASLSAKLQAGPPEQGVQVVPVDKWQSLGTSIAKVDGPAVVTGQVKYPSDIVRPQMLYGKVLRPISYGAKLSSIDLTSVKAMAGIVVVHDGEFVGCAAATSRQATLARDAMAATAKWERPSHPASSELFEHLKRTARSRSGARTGGDDIEKTLGDAKQRLDAQFTISYIQHAPMEPRSAVAEWTDGKLTVWTGSQQPARVQLELCQAFRLPPEQVRVIIPDAGGGFGGKHTGEAAVEAARLAKTAGRPVSLRWTREEEFTWAYFRPAGLIEVRAGLDATGKLNSWDFTNYNSGGSAIETPYQVPGARSQFVEADSPLRQGSYRALASTANTFARESAMDELAELAGADPFEFRLKHLPEGRLKDVLNATAKKFDWTRQRSDRKANRGVGLACGTEKGSYVAACAEVEVSGGEMRVLKICQAFECGAIQNPGNLRVQVEGAVIMGLGGALFEAVEFKNGQVLNNNFSAYRVPRMSDMPELDIVLLDRRDLPSVGGGETPIIAVAPAIANALYQAVGTRSRSMPLRLG